MPFQIQPILEILPTARAAAWPKKSQKRANDLLAATVPQRPRRQLLPLCRLPLPSSQVKHRVGLCFRTGIFFFCFFKLFKLKLNIRSISTEKNGAKMFYQLAVSPTCFLINLLFRQPGFAQHIVSSSNSFTNTLFDQLVVS